MNNKVRVKILKTKVNNKDVCLTFNLHLSLFYSVYLIQLCQYFSLSQTNQDQHPTLLIFTLVYTAQSAPGSAHCRTQLNTYYHMQYDQSYNVFKYYLPCSHYERKVLIFILFYKSWSCIFTLKTDILLVIFCYYK